MSQHGRVTNRDREGLADLWRNGPPPHFIERFYGREGVKCFACDVCQKEIDPFQIRHHCMDCWNFDSCEDCYDEAAKVHAEHGLVEMDCANTPTTIEKYLLKQPGTENDCEIAEENAFTYTPLDTSKWEIRIVCLRPGSGEDKLECAMAHVSLYANIEFEALSYTWGSPQDPATMYLDGYRFPIGKNLFAALSALRHEDKSRYIWIDAVCINQEDNTEKSQEVQRMGQIYKQAWDVVVWLGDAADGSDMAMDLAASHHPRTITIGAPPYDKDPRWGALDRLVRRPWWTRVWCLQELASSRWSPTMVCGRKSASWMQLYDVCRKLPGYWEYMGNSAGEIYNSHYHGYTFARHNSIRSQYISQMELPILWLLFNTLSWESTDPRDRIFGLLGVCRREDRLALAADYTLSTRELYVRAARYMMELNLNSLCFNTNSQRVDIFDGRRLPSWVSDWSLGSARRPSLWIDGCYEASNPLPGSRFKPGFLPSVKPDVIKVAGGYLDRIEFVSDLIEGDEIWKTGDPSSMSHTIRMVENFVRRNSKLKAAFQGGPEGSINPIISNMLWRTLIADKECPQFAWTWPASPMFEKAYSILRARAWENEVFINDEGPQDATSNADAVDEKNPESSQDGNPRVGGHYDNMGDGKQDNCTETDTKTDTETDTETDMESDTGDTETDTTIESLVRRYVTLAYYTLDQRRVFLTQKGFFGLSSHNINPDDIVVILAGGDMPFVLRDNGQKETASRQDAENEATSEAADNISEDEDGLRVISEAFVHGAMDGKLFVRLPMMMFSIH